ncbi:homocysteine S-methyltransferase [Kineosporia sp. R_H_3]|uniref:homocysteine S-methyltransferase n=1 Tax=Kineosporia sp. R_H_3 TaxID=1961848 RepID=UPI000B4BDF2C|nr:homocysteine S-methyltransferase [Kineosporia sp. R_H_3]
MAQTPAAALADALAAGPVVLDGGLSTQLEAAGHDISGDLWSAVLLRDDPDAVRAAHAAFATAGARVAITASYQATFDGFAAAGIDHAEAERLMRLSVRLAREATDAAFPAGGGWVAGSVGPYGAMLANGEEYTGSYVDAAWTGRTGGGLTVAELTAWHRPRMEVLADAGADLLACETVPAAAEAEAIVGALDTLGVPGWLSLTTVTGPDGVARTRRGEDAAAVFALAKGVDAVVAVGVNCTDPAGLLPAIEAASAAGKPVVVYPNSGETWDGAARVWRGTPDFAASEVTAWATAGARLVGGCCRVGPAQVASVAAALGRV